MPPVSPAVTPFHVVVDAKHAVTARLYGASGGPGARRAVLALAHGAGAGQASPFMVDFATALALRGIDTVTFNFPYTEAGRRLPDAPPLLEATWRAVLRDVAARPDVAGLRLFAGGKSMGGRIASQVAAKPGDAESGHRAAAVAGLVFLGYPLHPPGRPAERRDRHLAAIACPMLFVQGERDAFGKADEMRALTSRLPLAELYLVAGGNHSLQTPTRAAPSRAEVLAAVQDYVAAWVRRQAASS